MIEENPARTLLGDGTEMRRGVRGVFLDFTSKSPRVSSYSR
jgi:hypothetical protein